MGRPKKNQDKTKQVKETAETADVGVPGLFAPQDWDIQEELMGNEALMELRREQQPEY